MYKNIFLLLIILQLMYSVPSDWSEDSVLLPPLQILRHARQGNFCMRHARQGDFLVSDMPETLCDMTDTMSPLLPPLQILGHARQGDFLFS